MNTNTLPKTPLAFALSLTKKYIKWAVIAFGIVMIAQTIESVRPYILKLLTDSIANPEAKDMLVTWKFAGLYLAAHLFAELAWRAGGIAGMNWITRVEANSNTVLLKYLAGHGSQYFSDRFAGNLANKVANISDGVSRQLGGILWTFFRIVLQFAISIWLVYSASPWFAVIFISLTVIFIPISYFLIRKKSKLSEISAKASSELNGQVVDVTTNIMAVHHYTKKNKELGYLNKFIERKRTAFMNSWRFTELYLTFCSIFVAFLLGSILFLSLYFWDLGKITTGDVVMLITIGIKLQGTLFSIGGQLNNYMEDHGKVKEGLEEIVVEYDIKDEPQAKALNVSNGNINFDNIHFHYKKGTTIFDSLNLKIAEGQKIGLVGESGVGKSTLTSLLLRLYDIQKGTISIDGQDISRVKQESLRENIAFVPQEPLLFHRSIAENIQYGKDNATKKEVEKVAKLANAHEFINKLPEKYDTFVGERGVKLSGGQKQRVAIARAMLKHAPILVLDEATSALDSESESLVQDALKHLMKGKTVLAIAHRLSTLLAMDRIIVLDKGKIVEDGTHKELLKKKGIYAKLWNHQAGGFIQ